MGSHQAPQIHMVVEVVVRQEMVKMDLLVSAAMADCQKNPLLPEFLQFIQILIGQQAVLEDIFQEIHMLVPVQEQVDMAQEKAYLFLDIQQPLLAIRMPVQILAVVVAVQIRKILADLVSLSSLFLGKYNYKKLYENKYYFHIINE